MNGPFERFPYTNFHDLNMDWVIKIAKDFLDQYTTIQDTIQQGLTDIDDKTQQSLTELEEKKTELEGLLDQWYETHSEYIADELEDAIREFDEHVQEVIGTLPEYAELALEFNNLHKAIMHTENRAGTLIPNYYIDYRTGAAVAYQDENFFITDFINITPGSKIAVYNYRPSIQEADYAGIAFYDVSGTYISGIQYEFPNNPILTTAPSGAVTMRASYFSNIDKPLEIYSSRYTNTDIALRCTVTPFNSAPAAPYDNANTIPIGTICTYIGMSNFPSNLPSYINTEENVVTIITENYKKSNKGGAVQTLVGVRSTFVRYADNESTYSDWRRLDMGGIAVYDASTLVAPWDDCDTIPKGTIVTYIGYAYMPDNAPAIHENVATVVTLNYSQSSLGGSIQLWFDTTNVWFRLAINEQSYMPWSPMGVSIYDESVFSLFPHVGLIGDSYCTGTLTLTSAVGTEYPVISWGKIIERQYGINVDIFASGGLNTRTWLSDANGLTKMNSADAQDLYILSLGINDTLLGTAYIGTTADIGTAADTFYGNYSAIIEAVQTKAPYAKIAISTICKNNIFLSNIDEFNTAIENLADHYDIAILNQNDDSYLNSEQYLKDQSYNHPIAAGYAHLAEAYNRMLRKAVDQYKDYFKDYGTHVTWTSEQDQIDTLAGKITNKTGTGTLSNIHTDVSVTSFNYAENNIMAQVYLQFTVSANIAAWTTIFELPFAPKMDYNAILINDQQIYIRSNKEVRTNGTLAAGTYYASFTVMKS